MKLYIIIFIAIVSILSLVYLFSSWGDLQCSHKYGTSWRGTIIGKQWICIDNTTNVMKAL